MSLRYLWNKLDNMNALEQEAYIKNIFIQFNITPIYPVEDNFKDTEGKQSKGKNPLGYLLMHLDPVQLDELIPKYLRNLYQKDTFSTQSRILYDMVKSAVECIKYKDSYFYFPYKCDPEDVVEVFSLGVVKYHPWSFLKLSPYTLIPAMFRHLYKYFNISKTDEETGVSHLAHAECNRRMIEIILTKGERYET